MWTGQGTRAALPAASTTALAACTTLTMRSTGRLHAPHECITTPMRAPPQLVCTTPTAAAACTTPTMRTATTHRPSAHQQQLVHVVLKRQAVWWRCGILVCTYGALQATLYLGRTCGSLQGTLMRRPPRHALYERCRVALVDSAPLYSGYRVRLGSHLISVPWWTPHEGALEDTRLLRYTLWVTLTQPLGSLHKGPSQPSLGTFTRAPHSWVPSPGPLTPFISSAPNTLSWALRYLPSP